jgi:hypothetical protein
MEVFRHLVVAGNVLVYHPDDGTVMRLWRLDQYVVRRDAQGNLLEGRHRRGGLPLRARRGHLVRWSTSLRKTPKGTPVEQGEDKVKLYTMILRGWGQLIHYQEINDIEVPGSRGQAKADVSRAGRRFAGRRSPVPTTVAR